MIKCQILRKCPATPWFYQITQNGSVENHAERRDFAHFLEQSLVKSLWTRKTCKSHFWSGNPTFGPEIALFLTFLVQNTGVLP